MTAVPRVGELPRPLQGVRVVDLSRYVAGPYCGSILADLGAEVIRVEPVGGGKDRGLVPVGGGAGGALFLQVNRNKKSLALDSRSAEGRALLERLIATADVVITNMPTKALQKQSLDRASLERIKPGIISANVSAFGVDGRLSERNGFDGVGQGMSGAAYLGGKAGSPSRAGCSYVDFGTGLAAALGVLAALLQKKNCGVGQEVQASLLATAITFANGWHIEQALRQLDRRPFGNRSPNSAPSDIYQTADGFIVVQVIGSQMFARWARVVGRGDLLQDRRLSSDAARGRHGARLSRIMSEWAAHRTSSEALAELARNGVPAGPVYSPQQVLDDDLIAETGVLQQVPHVGLDKPAPLAAPIVRLGRVDLAIKSEAPLAGQQTQEILQELGLASDEIATLSQRGTISCSSTDTSTPKRSPRKRRRQGSPKSVVTQFRAVK